MADMSNEQGEYTVPDEARRLAREAALVIDPRLADLWQLVWTRPDDLGDPAVPLATVAALLRLAYVQGYADAHAEENAGALYAELGLPAPRRARPRPTNPSRHGRGVYGNSDK